MADGINLRRTANDAGFDFTVEELREYVRTVREYTNSKLTDDELGKVSGGGGNGDYCSHKGDYYCYFSDCPIKKGER